MRTTLAVALFAVASSLSAQVHETVNVAVTNADLVVTDSKGNPVHGLTAADFELFEGNKKRDITNLSEVSVAAPGAGETAKGAATPSRAVLILFDNTSLTLPMRRNAAEALKTWMGSHLRPIDKTAVVEITPALVTKQPWTFDYRQANAAIDVVAGESTSMIEQQRRDARKRVDEVVQRAATASQREVVRFDEATQAVRSYAGSAMRDAQSVLAAMTAALTYFPASAQKKVLLVIGEGLDVNPGADLFQYLNSVKMDIESGAGPSTLRSGAQASSPLTEMGQFDVAPAVRAMQDAAVRNGIMIYAINPGQNENTSGQVESAPNDTRAQFATSSGNRAGYEMLVRPTGGAAFYGAPPAMALSQVSNDIDSYYSIGFKPGAANEPPGQLVVKSKAGYRVRATRAPAPQSFEDKMREAVLAHHVAPPMSNDMKIAVASDAPVADAAGRKVHLKVLIPVASLKLDREGTDVIGGFVVYVSSGDNHGGATRVNRQEHQIRWPADSLAALKDKTITFAVDVVVPNGLSQISVGVMDEKSMETGFDRVMLGS